MSNELILDSLQRRFRALFSLYEDATATMTLEQVNHREKEKVMPIAFSLFHYVNMIDASMMMLTGEFIDAQRAYDLGLVNRVTDGSALDAALELAAKVTANGPVAVRVSKQVINESPDWSYADRWNKQAELMPQVFMSEDAREGSLAFAEKRAPNWKGK